MSNHDDAKLCDHIKAELLKGVERDSELARAVAYHFNQAGKLSRAKLVLHVAAHLGAEQKEALHYAVAVEALHNASLIHDDIQDQDSYRRNQLALWKAFSPEIALCVGDLMISAAYSQLASLPPAMIAPSLRILHDSVSSAIQGQAVDTESKSPITYSVYEKMARDKSGALFSLAYKLVLTATGNQQYIHKATLACQHFAIGYQISDDIDDVDHDANFTNVISVLMHEASISVSQKSAKKAARIKAIKSFQTCQQYAEQLPNSIGKPLASMADVHISMLKPMLNEMSDCSTA